jgi:hypothetical protein
VRKEKSVEHNNTELSVVAGNPPKRKKEEGLHSMVAKEETILHSIVAVYSEILP